MVAMRRVRVAARAVRWGSSAYKDSGRLRKRFGGDNEAEVAIGVWGLGDCGGCLRAREEDLLQGRKLTHWFGQRGWDWETIGSCSGGRRWHGGISHRRYRSRGSGWVLKFQADGQGGKVS